MELVFKEEDEEEALEAPEARPARRRGRKRVKKNAEISSDAPPAKKQFARRGGGSEGFFKEKRAIKDIMDEARSQKGRTFKASDLSTPLVRFVRDKRLNRETNADGQFEYYK